MIVDTRTLLLDRLLPWWAEAAWDPRDGGFVAELGQDGGQIRETSRLLLVQARMLYVLSHAHRLGAGPFALHAAGRLRAFLEEWFRLDDGAWARAAAPEAGGTRDGLVDFYDQSFVLHGLAWWYRASGDPRTPADAVATLAALDRRLADPAAGGYFEDDTRRLPRRQNPHMHLLEAMHAWFEATGDQLWLDRAEAVVALFRSRFLDEATGTLREFLDAGLAPADGPAGSWREPGHHMEWVWLLLHHRRLTGRGDDLGAAAERLWETAEAHGVDLSGHLVEAVDRGGRVLDPNRLLWPQTEAVKAALARTEMLGADPAPADRFLKVLLAHHMPAGGPLWINRLSPEGVPLGGTMPTRILYHLTLALAEYARLRPSFAATGPAGRTAPDRIGAPA
ncbi:AGE family epimerase/isomerase [Prosthecomicrobium sp. N25]|uniref:AGE family epimerase/isomerase n=1 Tax=Prosthecomicrobium sp. N25 TaxID=3129254 RepID=UPI003077DFB6